MKRFIYLITILFIAYMLTSCQEEKPNTSKINWQNWEDVTFERAKSENKIILLDLCSFWENSCCIMQQTTYDNPSVISLIDTICIPIRVDSDKHPEINSRYNFGSLPSTVFLTPDGFVIDGGYMMPSGMFKERLISASNYYKENHKEIDEKIKGIKEQGEQTEQIEMEQITLDENLSNKLLNKVLTYIRKDYDKTHSGWRFGNTNDKFPLYNVIDLCLSYYEQNGDNTYLNMATSTLDTISNSALYDSVSGGFFRYASKLDWNEPHYEKLMKINAPLALTYLNAYRITGNEHYSEVAEGILTYLMKFLYNDEHNVFLIGQDSNLKTSYGAKKDLDGSYYYNYSLEQREEIGYPYVPSDIYTSANGLAIILFLEASIILEKENYKTIALKSLDFLMQNLFDENIGMYHYYDGTKQVAGLLSDQVIMGKALIKAYKITSDNNYLEQAKIIADLMQKNLLMKNGAFGDKPYTPNAYGRLIIREHPFLDNAKASYFFLDLYHLTNNIKYKQIAHNCLIPFTDQIKYYRINSAEYVQAIDYYIRSQSIK